MDITRRKFLGTASVGVASVGAASVGLASVGPASAKIRIPALTGNRDQGRIIMEACERAADPPLVNTFPGGLTYIDEDFCREYEKSVYANFRKIT